MRIVVLQDYLRCGGTEMQSLGLAAGFQSLGWDVRLVTLRPGGPLLNLARSVGLVPLSLQPFDFKLNWVHPGLTGVLREINPDGILLMGRNANSLGVKIMEGLPAAKVFGSLRTGRRIPSNYKKTLETCHHVFTNSNWGAARLAEFGISQQVTVIPNGLVHDLDFGRDNQHRGAIRKKLNTPESRIVLLKVAAFRRGKNHLGLLETMTQLKGDWGLWLAGDGPERKTCESFAKDADMDDRIRFLGEVEEVAELYGGADIAVSNSGEECLPNFLAEAQTAGLPVVARDCAGVAETFLPDESGFLAGLGNNARFLESIQRLVDNRELREQMSVIARPWALKQFSQRDRLADYASTIQAVTGRT